MSPATGTALLILVAFVLPGFVTLLIKERLYEVASEQQAFERLLQTLYYSVLVYTVPLAAALIFGADRRGFEAFFTGRADLRLTAVIAVAVLLVLPLVVAYCGRRWLISETREKLFAQLALSDTHRIPSSWDFAFEDSEPCLIVRLKNGAVIGGYYGPESHSGYGTRHRDLFLEDRYEVHLDEDGAIVGFNKPPRTLGVWIYSDEVAAFERYAVDDAQARELRGGDATEERS